MNKETNNIIQGGKAVNAAKGALVLLHGRGGSAQDILSLGNVLNAGELAWYAPQASNGSWYPYSFMAKDSINYDALENSLKTIDEVVKKIKQDGIAETHIYFAGFSQGACLTLEYIARNANPYGGAVAFTGGLIGEHLDVSKYSGDLIGMPVLITTGVPDQHVPLDRVQESVNVFKSLDAAVTLKTFPGKPHTIIREEIDLANSVVFNKPFTA